MTAPANVRAAAEALMRAGALSDRAIAARLGVSNRTVSRWRRDVGVARVEPGDGMLDAAALERALEAQGISMGRFANWRRAGLLPPPARTWHHRGSASRYPPSIVDQAVTVDTAVRQHRSLARAALALLAAGEPVSLRAVRAAYSRHLHRYEGLVTGVLVSLDTTEEADAHGERLQNAARSSRGLEFARRAAKVRGLRPGESVAAGAVDYLADLAAIGAGRRFNDVEIRELHRVAPMFAKSAPRLSNLTAEGMAVAAGLLEAGSLQALRSAAATATREELVSAVAEMRTIGQMYGAFLEAAPGMLEPGLGPLPPLFDDLTVGGLAFAVVALKRNPTVEPAWRETVEMCAGVGPLIRALGDAAGGRPGGLSALSSAEIDAALADLPD